MDMHDVILQYQMHQEEVIKNMIRSHWFESVQDMKDKWYDIQKTVLQIADGRDFNHKI